MLSLQARSSSPPDRPWFEYQVQVHPYHTDYAGVVWHGTYIAWLEAARVECLQSWGLAYADLVALGCDLPVVDLSIRYRKPIHMGMTATVYARMQPPKGVRLRWDYEICVGDRHTLHTTATLTLVPIDRQGKILRQIPPALRDILQAHS